MSSLVERYIEQQLLYEGIARSCIERIGNDRLEYILRMCGSIINRSEPMTPEAFIAFRGCILDRVIRECKGI